MSNSGAAVRSILPSQSLYVMQNQYGLIKVGRSVAPETRRRALESSEQCRIDLVHARANEGHREEEFHIWLSAHRLAGEWFDGTEVARSAVEEALALDKPLHWPRRLDRVGATAWLEGFLDRQDLSYVQREISRSHGRLRDMQEPGWVWDAVLWDLYWLMEAGVRPTGTVERGGAGEIVQRTWVEGREFCVPRFTTDFTAAMTLWPEADRPFAFPTSIIECCKAAIDARRARWRKRKGLRGAGFKPVARTTTA